MREGISALLALDDQVELVEGCASYDELLTAVDIHWPDVVITDIRMPPTQTTIGSGTTGWVPVDCHVILTAWQPLAS